MRDWYKSVTGIEVSLETQSEEVLIEEKIVESIEEIPIICESDDESEKEDDQEEIILELLRKNRVKSDESIIGNKHFPSNIDIHESLVSAEKPKPEKVEKELKTRILDSDPALSNSRRRGFSIGTAVSM